MLLLPLAPARKSLWQSLWSIVLHLILIINAGALLGDIVYFGFVKRHITYEILFLKELGELRTILSMALTSYLPYLICFFIVIRIVSIFWKRGSTLTKDHSIGMIDYGIYVTVFLMLAIFTRGGLGSKPIAIIDAFASGNTQQGNLILNGVFSMSHSLLKAENINHHFFEEIDALKIAGFDIKQAGSPYPLQQRSTLTPTHHNLVFILVESLSIKYMDSYGGNGYGVTGNLDRLAREGIRFVNFYANGQRSVEGIQATLTGIPPIVGMPTIATGLVANYSKLGTLAEENGYATIFLQSSKKRSLRIDSIAGSTGFREYYGKEDMPPQLDYPDPEGARWGWDYEMLMKAADRMEMVNKPFLVYAITSTTHTPYPRLPAELEKYPPHSNSENGFLNTLNYTDWCIGEFFKRIESSFWFKDTIFIITADHALAHYQKGELRDRFQIPLIVYAPGIVKPAVIDTVASQIDMMPTIIDILRLQGNYSSYGDSIFRIPKNRFAIFKEGSVMGIITEKGFLRHSLKNRLEAASFQLPVSADYFDSLERKLLASDQLVYELVTSNRWSD
ncbi:LTA synthase family protein [bacterium]|nr:LTA synthase family protein [bacterium]